MGDKHRAEVFVDFIEKQYPANRFRRVLDVAGGAGYVSLELALRGYSPTIVDPRATDLRRKDRRAYRLERGRITRLMQPFEAEMAQDADLVVAMHPDGATEEAARASRFAPSMLVPCCNYWSGHEGAVENAVRRVLNEITGGCWETQLDMKGKNLVLWSS